MPNGFKYKEGSWNNGYTIIGETENANDEFVWVPCVTDQSKVKEEDTVVTFGRITSGMYNSNNYTNITDGDNSASEIRTSVEKYGGFYIAKYEAGVNGKNDNYSLNSKTVTNGTVKPLSQAGKGVWNYITRADAIIVSKAMINQPNTGVKSTLISGECWDTTLQWIVNASENKNNEPNKGYDINSTGKGWYSDVSSNIKHTTGCYAVNNIYDMAGNVLELTIENGFYDGTNHLIFRGGSYAGLGSVGPASFRGMNIDVEDERMAFRVVLYK